MTREALEKLIDDDILAAFKAMDQLDWRGYQGSYQELKENWVDLPQGSSKSSFRSQLKTLLGLHFSTQLQPTFPETRLLTLPPFIPELFLGREADLDAVYHKLFHEEHLLLLVNGQGGIGKTTLAAKYWERYKSHYSHVAWVFAGDDLTQALLALAPELNLSFSETMPNVERLPLLIKALCALNKPCLLIIDNANDLSELENNYLALRSCANFHILLTSRITEFEQATRHTIQPLEQDVAIELFQRHYPKYQPSEQALLLQIFNAVGYNTLVIELLAKNLRNLNKLREQYSMKQLLQDFQEKGILGISQSSSVNTVYQAKGAALRQASPESIIRAMYELGDLTQEEKQLLSVFAVLPAERIELAILEKLLPNTPLDTPLSNLALLGWLDFEEQELSFKISPVVQQIVREQNKLTLREDCQILIDALNNQLEWKESGHYDDYRLAAKLMDYSISLIACLNVINKDIAILCERVGMYYKITGNLNAALQYFRQFENIENSLLSASPNNILLKNSLANSYERLGMIHTDLGDIKSTMAIYRKLNSLREELHEENPGNITFKNGVAISYSKLGNTYLLLGDLEQALVFIEKFRQIEEDLNLFDPDNIFYKNGLAVSYSLLGDIYKAKGSLGKASQFFEKRFQIGEYLHNAFPNNPEFKKGLAISYEKLGDIYNDIGNLQQALFSFFNEVQIFEELFSFSPKNVSYKYGLAIACGRLGSIYLKLDNLLQAQSFFEKQNFINEELYGAHSENVNYQYGLAISYLKLGDLHRVLSNLPEALFFFEKSHSLNDELHGAYPDDVNYKYSLAVSCERLGGTLNELGNSSQALSLLERCNSISEELKGTYSEDLNHLYSLAISYSKLAAIHLQQDNMPKAKFAFEQYHSISEELYNIALEYVDYHYTYAESLAVRAALRKLEGHDASQNLNTAAQHLETLYQKSPRDHYKKKLALIHQMQAAEGDALKELIITISKD